MTSSLSGGGGKFLLSRALLLLNKERIRTPELEIGREAILTLAGSIVQFKCFVNTP